MSGLNGPFFLEEQEKVKVDKVQEGEVELDE